MALRSRRLPTVRGGTRSTRSRTRPTRLSFLFFSQPTPLRLCVDNETGKEVAIKLMNRGFSQFDGTHVAFELQLQTLMASAHVVQLERIVLTRRHLGLVMEYMPGGSLHFWCAEHKPDEQLACFLFRQIVDAVSYLHAHQVRVSPRARSGRTPNEGREIAAAPSSTRPMGGRRGMRSPARGQRCSTPRLLEV